MNKVSATQFKVQCLKTLDNIPEEGLVITKRGKNIALIVPYKEKQSIIGKLEGKITFNTSPDKIYSTGVKWNAES